MAKVKKPVPTPPATDFEAVASECHRYATEDRGHGRLLEEFAERLGVTEYALECLAAGFAHDRFRWTFPQRDGKGLVCGIATRHPDDPKNKRFFTGSKPGLIFDPAWPLGPAVFCPEGPTCTAAFYSLDLPAVGRHNSDNPAVAEMLGVMLARAARDGKLPAGASVVIVGDNDGNGAGRIGAEKTARVVAKMVDGSGLRVLVAQAPAGFKDVREWVRKQTEGREVRWPEPRRIGKQLAALLLAGAVEVRPERPKSAQPVNGAALTRDPGVKRVPFYPDTKDKEIGIKGDALPAGGGKSWTDEEREAGQELAESAGFDGWTYKTSIPCPRRYRRCNRRVTPDKKDRVGYNAVHQMGCDSNDCYACFPRGQARWADESSITLANCVGDTPLFHARVHAQDWDSVQDRLKKQSKRDRVPLEYLAVKPDGVADVVSTVRLNGAAPVDPVRALQVLVAAIDRAEPYERKPDLDADRGLKRRCYPHIFFRSRGWGPKGPARPKDWQSECPCPNPLLAVKVEADNLGYGVETHEFNPPAGAVDARVDMLPPEELTEERRERDLRQITGYKGPWKAKRTEDTVDNNDAKVG